MSFFKLGVKGIQEVLVIVLMLVFILVLYSPLELTSKIGVAVVVFSVILLTTLATQAMKHAEENQRIQSR